MKILFLDDDAERHKAFARTHADYVPAWTYAEACEAMRAHVFDVAFLDHDLGDPQGKTGEDVTRFLVALPPEQRPRFVVIHSYNAYGRWNMAAVLRDAGVPYRIELFHSALR